MAVVLKENLQCLKIREKMETSLKKRKFNLHVQFRSRQLDDENFLVAFKVNEKKLFVPEIFNVL